MGIPAHSGISSTYNQLRNKIDRLLRHARRALGVCQEYVIGYGPPPSLSRVVALERMPSERFRKGVKQLSGYFREVVELLECIDVTLEDIVGNLEDMP